MTTSLPPGPPATVPPVPLTRSDAEALGQRIQQQAAVVAEATCEFLLMVGDFDARGGSGWYVGLKSTAHWLAWACSMSPGTAREHVRVARALHLLPVTVAEFRAGRLSYSKVREITRVADRVDEQTLVEMARAMTASQLARTISSFRAVDGSRLGQDAARQARWQVHEDGMIEVRAVLPAEMGADVVTALELALDRDGHGPLATDCLEQTNEATATPETAAAAAVTEAAEVSAAATLEQRKADALVALAHTFLETEPDDRSGEDRHLVIVEVSAESLTQGAAGTPPAVRFGDGVDEAAELEADDMRPEVTPGSDLTPSTLTPKSVPAGTPQRCGTHGLGPLEVRTAERLVCNGKIALKVTDAGGEILYLGRSKRLATRAQRRALRLRDATCMFPACHQSKHLDAHHVTPWSQGGPTDIDGLALLCRRHHVMVHEGGLHLVTDPSRTSPYQTRFQVLDQTARPVQARWPAMLDHFTVRSTRDSEEPDQACGLEDPADSGRIAATTGGAGFRLADCVDILLRNVLELAA